MRKTTASRILEKVVEDYNNISDSFDKTRQYNWKEFEDYLAYIKENQVVADIGCGNGRFYKFLSEQRKINYIGIDNSKNLLKKAQDQFPKAKFLDGSLLNIPLEKHSVDIAVSIASLHHIPSGELRKKAIDEFYRILKANGTLILSVWNLFQPKYKKFIWQARFRYILSFGVYDLRDTFIPWENKTERYYYAFTPKELKKLLRKKFEIVEEKISNNLIFICRKK